MKTTRMLICSAVAAALATPLLAGAQAGPAPMPKFEHEKCYGIAKARQERLPDRQLVVRGTSKRDKQGDAWVYVPKGTCDKLVGREPPAKEGLTVQTVIGAGDGRSPDGRAGRVAGAGIGLRAPHVDEVIATHPPVGWLEVHAENYMGGGRGAPRAGGIRRAYPISLHGVGLSLGSADGLDPRHLGRLSGLVERLEPGARLRTPRLEHRGRRLPEPSAAAAVHGGEPRGRRPQRRPGAGARSAGRILVENPSSYLRFRHSPIPEPEFLAELVRRTGCGLLCDVNNIYVTAGNLGLDPVAYLDALPPAVVEEIHLAGHARNDADGQRHPDRRPRLAGRRRRSGPCIVTRVARFGPVPTLIEWDTDIPPLATLLEEAGRAERRLAAAPLTDLYVSAA